MALWAFRGKFAKLLVERRRYYRRRVIDGRAWFYLRITTTIRSLSFYNGLRRQCVILERFWPTEILILKMNIRAIGHGFFRTFGKPLFFWIKKRSLFYWRIRILAGCQASGGSFWNNIVHLERFVFNALVKRVRNDVRRISCDFSCESARKSYLW